MLDTLLASLGPREEQIVRMYYGIGGPAYRIPVIADLFAITPQWVSGILKRLAAAHPQIGALEKPSHYQHCATCTCKPRRNSS